MCVPVCLFTNYPITIPISDKTAETAVQAFLQHIYVIFDGSLTLLTDNGKEFKNDLLKKVAAELRKMISF